MAESATKFMVAVIGVPLLELSTVARAFWFSIIRSANLFSSAPRPSPGTWRHLIRSAPVPRAPAPRARGKPALWKTAGAVGSQCALGQGGLSSVHGGVDVSSVALGHLGQQLR